jgi:hypothetical protein
MVGPDTDRVACFAFDVLAAGNSGVGCGFEATIASIAGAAANVFGGAKVAFDAAGLTDAGVDTTADVGVTATVDDVR